MPAYKDPKNNTWYVKYSQKELDGKFHGKTKRGFATKRDALKWETEEKRKIHGVLDMSFGSFCDLYLESQKPRLKPSTLSMKRNIIYKHIVPYFSSKRVNSITTHDVMEWQTHILETVDPKTGSTYKKSFLKTIHNQLNAILNFAVRYYGLSSNPAHVVGNMGNDREIEMNFWTKEQYLKFRECMMDEPMFYYAFECLYWLGIREGEMLALTPGDFDFDKGEVRINKTFYILKGKHYITSPKTIKSVRKIKMPKFLCDELQDYLQLVFLPSDDIEERMFPVTKSSVNRALKRGTKKAGLPEIRVHDLRHSHVSLLIHLGYSAVAIADRLGHESIHVTYRYAHLFPSVQDDMAKKLNESLGDDYV